jgi:hypothetical protein
MFVNNFKEISFDFFVLTDILSNSYLPVFLSF